MSTTELFDHLMENIEEVIDATDLKHECAICSEAFADHAECEVVYAGTPAYFDTKEEQWYPGEPSEYEVTGYEAYLNEVTMTVVNILANYLHIYPSAEFVKLVKDNIFDIFQDELLDEDSFRERAIDEYQGY